MGDGIPPQRDRHDGTRCMVMRGGTSKGLYFLAGDLPSSEAARDQLLLRVMGSPDARQIDGMGGAHPLTSKVAVVSRSPVDGVDVDYLFLQVAVDQAVVSDQQTCGNLLAGVGPFALERGLVELGDGGAAGGAGESRSVESGPAESGSGVPGGVGGSGGPVEGEAVGSGGGGERGSGAEGLGGPVEAGAVELGSGSGSGGAGGRVGTGSGGVGASGSGSVDVGERSTVEVRIRMLNTGGVAVATVPVEGGRPVYDGSTAISGVPGTAAPIRLDFEDVAGASCGSLLPTGNPVDEVAGLEVTLIDNGMPVVVLRAADLGVTGYEPCEQLEANAALRETLERVRLAAGPLMGLGDVASTTVPKLTLVAPPREGGSLSTRTFIPHRCHDAIGVLGAVSVATAALLPEGPASEVAVLAVGGQSPEAADQSVEAGDRSSGARGAGSGDHVVVIEHPTGTFDAAITLASPAGAASILALGSRSGQPGAAPRSAPASAVPVVERAGIIRTARKLMDGLVF